LSPKTNFLYPKCGRRIIRIKKTIEKRYKQKSTIQRNIINPHKYENVIFKLIEPFVIGEKYVHNTVINGLADNLKNRKNTPDILQNS
jgi:hypothetical protein